MPLALLTLSLVTLVQGTDSRDPMPEQDPLPELAMPEITAAELEHHVRFLAADELLGRETGTPGCARAARYLARALEAAGLEPAGDAGTFLQAVPLVAIEHDGPPRLRVTLVDGQTHELEHGSDFGVGIAVEPRDTGPLEVRVVRSAEELPSAQEAAGLALFVDASLSQRREWLEQEQLGQRVGLELRTFTGTGRSSALPRPRLERPVPDEPDRVTLYGAWAERLAAGELARVELTYQARIEEVVDHNVIGVLRGAGTAERPELAREAVVFSAHFDHIGVLPSYAVPADAPDDFDAICNGADDDASGTAAILELAGALAAGEPPARTLVFLLATGEEKGLLGTWHYIDHPPVPLSDTVANLNFEMIGRPDELVGGAGKLWLTGFERTNLGPAFAAQGLDLVADPRPDQRFFLRSDNIAFVRRGVVGQTLSSYGMHEDYHRPSDEAHTLDYAHMQQTLEAGLVAARLLAEGELTPAWSEGEPRLR